jgi:hypothetical protein
VCPKLLGIAFVAMLIASASDLMDPWPLKIIFDYVIGSKPMPPWLARWPAIGDNRLALLNAAAFAVVAVTDDPGGSRLAQRPSGVLGDHGAAVYCTLPPTMV